MTRRRRITVDYSETGWPDGNGTGRTKICTAVLQRRRVASGVTARAVELGLETP